MRLRMRAERAAFTRTGVIFAGMPKNIQQWKKIVDKTAEH